MTVCPTVPCVSRCVCVGGSFGSITPVGCLWRIPEDYERPAYVPPLLLAWVPADLSVSSKAPRPRSVSLPRCGTREQHGPGHHGWLYKHMETISCQHMSTVLKLGGGHLLGHHCGGKGILSGTVRLTTQRNYSSDDQTVSLLLPGTALHHSSVRTSAPQSAIHYPPSLTGKRLILRPDSMAHWVMTVLRPVS